jgi:hypothetical protein
VKAAAGDLDLWVPIAQREVGRGFNAASTELALLLNLSAQPARGGGRQSPKGVGHGGLQVLSIGLSRQLAGTFRPNNKTLAFPSIIIMTCFRADFTFSYP